MTDDEIAEAKRMLRHRMRIELQIVRAFVERAEARLPSYSSGRGADDWLKNYHRAVKDELSAMEAEVKE